MKKYRTCENKKTGLMRNKLKPKKISQLLKGWKPSEEPKGEKICKVT